MVEEVINASGHEICVGVQKFASGSCKLELMMLSCVSIFDLGVQLASEGDTCANL